MTSVGDINMIAEKTRIFALLVAAAAVFPASRARADQLDTDIRLFTVLTAINLAGYDEGLGSPSDSPVRRAIRDELSDFDGSSLALLKTFYQENKRVDAGATLSQYVSYALVTEGPPYFEVKADLPTDLPPDVRRIRGLGPILAEFYNQAPIERLWSKYQPEFDREITRYQEPLIQALFEAAGYVRVSPTSREVQSFQIVFDLLAAANQLNTRAYGGKVYVVVHPSKKLHIEEIRHAFLLHLLDRLAIRHGTAIGKKEILSRFAMFAPALDPVYKGDFQLLVSKCVVKAVEARLSRRPQAERMEQVEQDLREGYILTPYFYDALEAYEKQGQELRLYYPEMIEAINLKQEAARLQDIEFAEAPSNNLEPVTTRPQVSKADVLLHAGEIFLADRKPLRARNKFEQALVESEGPNPDAAYGLARVALAEGDPDLAMQFFEQALAAVPDPHVESMSRVYLGRIADITGLRDQAIEQYRAALEVRNIPDRARELAAEGLDQPFESGRRPSEAVGEEEDGYDHEAAAWGDEGDWDDAEDAQDEDGSDAEDAPETERRARP